MASAREQDNDNRDEDVSERDDDGSDDDGQCFLESMSSSRCSGRGDCFTQCACTNSSGGYCRQECPHNCQLVECYNYRICEGKYPQWYLDCHNGMNQGCAMSIGRVTFLDETGDCSICRETKDLVQVSCEKHKFCLPCWMNWCESTEQCPVTCPLCRESIWAFKRRRLVE